MKTTPAFPAAHFLTLVFFILLSLTSWAQEADKPMKDKPLSEGTLDYLQPDGQKSAYFLTEDPNSGSYESNEDVPPGDMLRYQVKDITKWLNKYTGEVVGTDPDDSENFYTLTLKELTPAFYQFAFKENVLHLSYGSPDPAESNTITETIDINIPSFSPEDHPYRFTYSYSQEDVKDQALTNPSGHIKGVFKEQQASAIFNDKKDSTITIEADFIRNTRGSGSNANKGGAVHNVSKADIKSVTGNFIGNYAELEGGAFWSWGGGKDAPGISVGSISGVFINNEVKSENGEPHRGGAIFNANYAEIGVIRGVFIGNYVYGKSSRDANLTNVGGAIYNAEGGKIKSIYADFIGNHISGKGHGGAIYNGGGGDGGNTEPVSIIEEIVGDFIANYIETTDQYDAYGGAISNQAITGPYRGGAVIHSIKGDFVQNYTLNHYQTSGGGALYNNRQALVHKIEGNFIQNHTTSKAKDFKDNKGYDYIASGGAIMNFHALDLGYDITQEKYCSTIREIDGNFFHNYAEATGAAIAQGGAIANHDGGSIIGTITGDFVGNHADANQNYARGGAIFTDDNSRIERISGNFYNNYVTSQCERANGGAIRNGGMLDTIVNAVFEGNYAESYYEADPEVYMSRFIANPETRAEMTYNGEKHKNVGNIYYQIGAFGGAIFNESTLTILADGSEGTGIVFFNGNRTKQGNGTERNEAIYGRDGSEITLNAVNNGAIFFNDRIRGEQLYALVGVNDKVSAILSNTNADEINTHKDEVEKKFGKFERVEQVGDGFKLTLTGDNTNSAVVFSAPVSYADLTLDKISLVLHVEPETDVASDLLNSYLTDAQKERYGEDYRVSYILRASSLDTRSGQVALQDGLTTEYFIGTLKANEKHNIDGITEIPPNYTEDKAQFNIDVNLDRGVSDIFTVFGVKVNKSDTDWKPVNWGNERKSLSTGYVTISPTFLLKGNSYTYENHVLREKMFTIQVINFVVMEGQQGTPVLDYDYYAQFREPNTDIIQLTEMPEVSSWARSYMNSSDVLAKGIWLSTTKTYHDSFTILGWRDPLAAWAELLPDDVHGGWDKSENGEKVYELLPQAYVTLTRNTVDKTTATDNDPATAKEEVAAVQGTDNWTIKGGSGSVLNLDGHNLLSEVTKSQQARLQNFALMGVQGRNILNEGDLTLDTMEMESQQTIDNENRLTLTGKTTMNYTITSAEANREMVIENTSAVSEKTIVNIEGMVENQNIAHRGEGAQEKDNFTTDTILRVTEAADAESRLLRDATDTEEKDLTLTEAFRNFRNNSLDLQGGRFNLIGTMPSDVQLRLRDLTMSGGTLRVERSQVDLAKKQMGSILADTASGNSGEIYLADMSIATDSKEQVTHVFFVNEEVGDTVKDNNIRNNKARGPIYEYDVTYADLDAVDSQGEHGRNGYYTFTRTDQVNSAVLPGPVNEQTTLVNTLLIHDYAFEHANLFSDAIVQARRDALYESSYAVVTPMKGKEANSPAASGCASLVHGKGATGSRRALWARPYASFENVPLHHGPKVSMDIYGALLGADSDLSDLGNGWLSVFTAYLGYTGSRQRWQDNRTHTNGGVIGATETLYKGNFYTALTISAGLASGNATTMYGREDFHTFAAGIASRSGYNFALDDCAKYVLQPSLQLSYTFVGTGDYTNGAGVHLNSSPLQAFQIHPFVKLFIHEDDDWTPYVLGGFVWNMGGEAHYRADGEKLPELGISSYAEYGVGVQKVWKDRYIIYGQATGRSGGRQGYELSTGVRWNW